MKTVIEIDLADAETRVLDFLADSQTDLYRKRAAEKYGVPYNEVTVAQRKAAKREMYWELYSSPTGRPITDRPP